MVDKRQLLELVGHYAAILLVVTVVLAVVRSAFGEIGFWVELAIVIAVVAVYRPIVKSLGVEPSAWNRDESA
ncbi:hypothetical protein [Halosimplex salinum]|uniref:hypothetical protein n=1 Tax=Halosimplex salinum TaxID=1710538 RepID=UPI000F4A7794|nr:hypothetical protein [Halosimplex salinum]